MSLSQETPINITVSIYVEGSETMVVSSVLSAFSEMIGNISHTMMDMMGGKKQLSANIEYVAGSPDLRPIDTMAVGVLSYVFLIFMIITVTGGFPKKKLQEQCTESP